MKTGLPAKYAKMGFAKGWKAFKSAGKKAVHHIAKRVVKATKRKSHSSSNSLSKRIVPMAHKRSSSRLKKVNVKSTIRTIGIGLAGAIVANAGANLLPIADKRIKAGLPLALGVILPMLIKGDMVRLASSGMAIAGGLSLLRAQFGATIPALAGEQYIPVANRITETDVRNAVMRGEITQQQATELLGAPVEFMGAPVSYAGDSVGLLGDQIGLFGQDDRD